jgi:MFS family permease
MMPTRRVDRRRISGAAGFALFWTLVFAVGQLLDRDVDFAGLAAAFLVSGVIGYLAWPGLADVWARRDKQDDGKRFLMIGLGVAAGVALTRVVSILAGDDEARWSVGLWFVSVAAIFGLAFMRVRQARRSK